MNKKRISALILATILTFSVFTGCGNTPKAERDSSSASSSSSSSVSSSSESSSSESSSSESSSESTSSSSSSSSSSESASSDPIELQFSSDNNWKEKDKTCYEYKGYVVNNQSSAVKDWSITIKYEGEIKIKSSWGVTYKTENNTLKLTPESYNKEINPNASIDFGLQIMTDKPVDLNNVTLTVDGKTVNAKEKVKLPSNKNNQPSQNNSNSQNNNSNSPNNNNSNSANNTAKDVPEANTNDWLSVKGNKIVDADGTEVWLTGCNWFGYNTGTNTFDGLWACNLNDALKSIADHGFNLLRIPISTELLNNWEDGVYPEANYNNAENSYLNGMNSLEIFDYVIGQCRANGIKIMVDIHCAVTDAMGHMKPLWTDGDITEEDYLRGLKWIAERYKNDDTIIAIDLKNEPHGKQNESPRAKWDNSKDSDNWKYIAEKAGNTVLSANPNLLVMVEGIECYPKDIKTNGNFKSTNEDDYYFDWWGGNLRGVKDYPVDLGKYQNKLVYSPHDYGPTVYKQPWFEGNFDYNSLLKDCWQDNWFYIHEQKIAPLLIGEWGSKLEDEDDIKWITNLKKLIVENKINHTFWCFNANSGDTNGLVLDDFKTWDEDKYDFIKEALWQKDGKFIGLDHDIPLGENGISLSDYE